MMTEGAARRLRLKGLVVKETLQILRDPSSLLIAFVLPVLLLLLFGYGVSLDANPNRNALVVEYPTPRRCPATYYPETNVLVPIESVAERSNTPTSKFVIVTVAPSTRAGARDDGPRAEPERAPA